MRGGKRPGAGAPRGNLNALKTGLYSQNWRETRERKNKKHFGRGRRIDTGLPCNAFPKGHDFSRRNLHALKHGRYSKQIECLIETNPTIKAMRLNKEQARDYLVGQLKRH